MKNIALIKSIVATSANPAEHIAALIQAHPEETRENALATAELTVRPVDQVELTCNSTNLSFMGEPTVNLLERRFVALSTTHEPKLAGTRPRKTPMLQNVDKVTEEDRALMDVARDMWAGVIKKGL